MGLSLQPTTETAASGPDASAIAKVRPGYPDSTAEDKHKVEYVEKLWAQEETAALARYKMATHNILFANGRQWIDWVTTRRTWDDQPNASNEVRVTANYIKPILRARSQRLMSGEINWRGIPRSNAYADRDQTEVAVNLIRARWNALEMDAKIRAGQQQAFASGVVALKSFWNPNIGPLTVAKVEMEVPDIQTDPMSGAPVVVGMKVQDVPVDENGMPVDDEALAFKYRPGDTDTGLRTIFNIRLNPEAHGWTPAEGFRWLIDKEVVPLSVAKEKYPHIADQIRASEASESYVTYERIAMGSSTPKQSGVYATNPQVGKGGSNSALQETCTIAEYWEAQGPFFPEGRTIVVVGGACAYDGAWPQGVFPYCPLFDEPGIMTPYGQPSVNNMISPQQVINRELTAVVQEMMLSGVGQFVAWDVPGIAEQITTEPRAIVKIPSRNALGGKSIKDVFARLDPASVPSDRWRLIEQAKLMLFDIGAFHEVSRGQIPPGLDSGVAIEHLLEQEAGQLKDAVEALKRTLITWGRHQLAIARWGYGEAEERWLPIDRPDLGYMVESVNGAKLPDPDTIGLDIEYFRPQSEAATRAEVKELMLGGFIDPRRGLQILDMGRGLDGAFMSQTRHYARARTENLDFERGNYVEVPGQPTMDPMTGAVVVGPPQCMHVDPETGQLYPFYLAGHDDDLIHIDIHNEIALDDTKPWSLRQKVLLHIEQHRATMMAQAQAAAEQAAAAEGGSGEESSGPPK